MNQTNNLQPLRGWVSKFFVTQAGQKFGPYYARCWKHNGKLKKEYIKQNEVEQTRAACDAYREKQKRRSEKGRELKQIIANLSYLQRMERRSRKDALRPQDHAHLNRIETHGPTADGRPKLWTRNLPPRSRGKCPKGDGGASGATFGCDRQNPTRRRRSPQYRIPNTQYQKFMYPSNKSSFQTRIENIWKQAQHERFRKETPAEKWARWKKDHKAEPHLSHNIAPPLTIDAEELDAIIHRTSGLIKEAHKRGQFPTSSWLPRLKQ